MTLFVFLPIEKFLKGAAGKRDVRGTAPERK
jgi:hypothetical protein